MGSYGIILCHSISDVSESIMFRHRMTLWGFNLASFGVYLTSCHVALSDVVQCSKLWWHVVWHVCVLSLSLHMNLSVCSGYLSTCLPNYLSVYLFIAVPVWLSLSSLSLSRCLFISFCWHLCPCTYLHVCKAIRRHRHRPHTYKLKVMPRADLPTYRPSYLFLCTLCCVDIHMVPNSNRGLPL